MLYVLLFLLGLCLGSFINALVWRLRHKRDWIKERSECVHCGHVLAAKDLIPVFSWVSLRGKCRYCGKPIDDTPLTEAITAGLFGISYAAWPEPLGGVGLVAFLVWLPLLTILIALALYDLRYMLLPNRLVAAAAVVVISYTVFRTLTGGDTGYLLDAGFGLLAFGGLFYALFQISRGKWIGGGDVKLGFVLGAWLADYRLSLLAIFVASFIGTLYVCLLAIRKKVSLTSRLPFGPLLIMGAISMTLFGARLLDWYMNWALSI